MRPYFIFNNISSSDYLLVTRLPSIFKPQRNAQKIEIPGRDGFLTEDDGNYKSIVKTVECSIMDIDNIDFICSWLGGCGDVIFSNEPDRRYNATIINQIEFSKILRQIHSFIIQFECQPHKYAIDNSIITLASAGTIFNPGSANSKPVIKIFGTGSIDLNINSNIIHLTNITDYVTIDSILVDAYKDTQLMNNNMDGDFPELEPGTNTISWVGTVNKIEITPNWRWL